MGGSVDLKLETNLNLPLFWGVMGALGFCMRSGSSDDDATILKDKRAHFFEKKGCRDLPSSVNRIYRLQYIKSMCSMDNIYSAYAVYRLYIQYSAPVDFIHRLKRLTAHRCSGSRERRAEHPFPSPAQGRTTPPRTFAPPPRPAGVRLHHSRAGRHRAPPQGPPHTAGAQAFLS